MRTTLLVQGMDAAAQKRRSTLDARRRARIVAQGHFLNARNARQLGLRDIARASHQNYLAVCAELGQSPGLPRVPENRARSFGRSLPATRGGVTNRAPSLVLFGRARTMSLSELKAAGIVACH
jgi:hypothetical protein